MQNIMVINSDVIKNYQIDSSNIFAYKEFYKYAKSIDENSPIPLLNEIEFIHQSTFNTTAFYSFKNKKNIDKFNEHVYPMAVRYVSKNNTYVIERPPFQLDIDFRLGPAHSTAPKMDPLKIWVPWTVMVFNGNEFSSGSFSSLKLFFNDGPLQSIEDKLIPCFYPNSYPDGKICFSSSLNDFNNNLDLSQFDQGNIGYIYNYIFNNYMMGGWNADLSFNNYRFAKAFTSNYSHPTIDLFTIPYHDFTFSEKMKKIVPKSLINGYKKYYDSFFNFNNSRLINKPYKIFARNFAVLSAFTLEQTLSLVSELKEVPIVADSYYDNHNNKSVAKIIATADFNYLNDSNKKTNSIQSIYQNSEINLDYEYESYTYHIYIDNTYTYETSSYSTFMFYNKASKEVILEINKIIIKHIAGEYGDSPIAFCYDYLSNQFSVILNYDPETYITDIYQKTYDYSCTQIALNRPSLRSSAVSFFDTIGKESIVTYIEKLRPFIAKIKKTLLKESL